MVSSDHCHHLLRMLGYRANETLDEEMLGDRWQIIARHPEGHVVIAVAPTRKEAWLLTFQSVRQVQSQSARQVQSVA
jgi:hypothetical protein